MLSFCALALAEWLGAEVAMFEREIERHAVQFAEQVASLDTNSWHRPHRFSEEYPERNQAPSHEDDFALANVPVPPDHGLERLRRYVCTTDRNPAQKVRTHGSAQRWAAYLNACRSDHT
jgi:hypothetical protein